MIFEGVSLSGNFSNLDPDLIAKILAHGRPLEDVCLAVLLLAEFHHRTASAPLRESAEIASLEVRWRTDCRSDAAHSS